MPQIAISLAITAGLSAAEYFLTPKTKQQPVDKGKMDDIRLSGSDYGAFIPRLLSGKARLSGNVIWTNGYQTFTTTTGATGGKKGGGQPATTNYTYKTSVGVLVVQSHIGSFLRIWDDNNLLVNNTPASTGIFQAEDTTYATRTGSPTVASTGSGWNGSGYLTGLGSGNAVTFNVSGVSAPISRDPAETVQAKSRIAFYYKSLADKTATITCVTNGGTDTQTITLPNSGGFWTTYVHVIDNFASSIKYENASASTADLDQIYIEKFYEPIDFGLVPYYVSGVANPSMAYPTNLLDPSEYYNFSPLSGKDSGTGRYSLTTSIPDQQIRFYIGTETQTQDSAIVSWLDSKYGSGQGTLKCSAMRGQTYIVIQDYTLKSNSFPNFTFEIDKGSNTLNEALDTLFADVNLATTDYDITATAGYTQYGLLETTAGSRNTLIDALKKYHFFRLGEIDGKIRAIADSYTSIGTIAQTNLRGHDDSQSVPDCDVTQTLPEEHLLPKAVSVSYMDPALEYHNNAQLGQLFTTVATETVEYSFPIIDTADQARNRAERLLLKAWSEATTYDFTTMPSEAKYAIGDVITVPVNGSPTLMRVEKKSMPMPIGPVTFSCVSISPFVPAQTQDDVTTLAPKQSKMYVPSTFPRNSIAFPIPSVPIRDREKGRLGVYLAVSGIGRGNGDKIALYREMDSGDYVLQDTITEPTVMGTCAGTLGTWAGGTATIDTSNTLDIWFFNDIDLETVTDTDIARLPQINLIRIGSEWVQFKTATAQTLEANSPYRSKWRISNLWRGRFQTSSAISTHAASEYAALVTATMLFYDLEREDIGQTVNLKAVTAGQAITVAPVSSFTFTTGEAVTAVASEALTAGNMVNLWLSGGVLKMRKANATDNTKPADGYVVADVASGATSVAYCLHGSTVQGLSGLTIGTEYFLSTTGGTITATAPTSSGNISQKVGKAISATTLVFQPEPTMEVA